MDAKERPPQDKYTSSPPFYVFEDVWSSGCRVGWPDVLLAKWTNRVLRVSHGCFADISTPTALHKIQNGRIPHTNSHPRTASAIMKKIARGQSCVWCQQRKMRCDQKKPCTNCMRVQKECVVVPLPPPKPRRSKHLMQQQEQQAVDQTLVDRLRRCEALLAQHGVHVDEPKKPEKPMRTTETTENTSAPNSENLRVKWFAYYKEVSIGVPKRMHVSSV